MVLCMQDMLHSMYGALVMNNIMSHYNTFSKKYISCHQPSMMTSLAVCILCDCYIQVVLGMQRNAAECSRFVHVGNAAECSRMLLNANMGRMEHILRM